MMKGINTTIIILFLFIFSMINVSDAMEQQSQVTKNLSQVNSLEKKELQTLINMAYTHSKNNAYSLSVPLLAAAIDGDQTLYQKILDKMLEAIDDSNDTASLSYQAWLLGRILIAADTIGDDNTRERVSKLMLEIFKQTDIPQDVFSTWAWGYLITYYAGEFPDKYYFYKPELVKMSDNVVKNEDNISDILWTRIMELQAAALANDKSAYDIALSSMKKTTKRDTIVEALDMIPYDDYRAWAMSVTRLAAATINDVNTFNQLAKPLKRAMKYTPKVDDRTIALANDLLSEKRKLDDTMS